MGAENAKHPSSRAGNVGEPLFFDRRFIKDSVNRLADGGRFVTFFAFIRLPLFIGAARGIIARSGSFFGCSD
jgi:hypothetical protein